MSLSVPEGSHKENCYLSADALVILPGGAGTRSEAVLARRFGTPATSYGADYDEIPRARSLEEVEEFLLGVKDHRSPKGGP